MKQSYYDDHAKEYAALTVKVDMSPAYDRFVAYLPAGAAILDAGCGSGRDSLCFMKMGYDVTMLDASEGMCNCAEELTGQKALCMGFHEIEFADRFDGIWACASLLHVSEKELKNVLAIFHRALKRDGVLYASWKYGEAERCDGERFYCDMTEEKLRRVLARAGLEACEGLEARAGLFACLECWVAEDALPSGREQEWLNVVLGKNVKIEAVNPAPAARKESCNTNKERIIMPINKNELTMERVRKALSGFSVCLLLLLFCGSSALAAEILRETVPLERNRVPLHLERYIEKDGQRKQPLLLVHGVTYSSHEFDVDYKDYSLARYFAWHGFEVWLLDIAGFGNSGSIGDGFRPDSDYAAEDIAAAVRCIMRRSRVSFVDVLGWSWGTVTSGRFAARHPEMVRRLVLYAPIVAGLGEQPVAEPFHTNTWMHAAEDFQTAPDGGIDFRIVERPVADTFLSNAWRNDKTSSPNGGRRDLLVSPDTRLIPTADIKVPTLIIVGSKDPYVSPALCEEAYKTLPDRNSRLEIIEGGGHAMLMERPYYRRFRAKVRAFLSRGAR